MPCYLCSSNDFQCMAVCSDICAQTCSFSFSLLLSVFLYCKIINSLRLSLRAFAKMKCQMKSWTFIAYSWTRFAFRVTAGFYLGGVACSLDILQAPDNFRSVINSIIYNEWCVCLLPENASEAIWESLNYAKEKRKIHRLYKFVYYLYALNAIT